MRLLGPATSQQPKQQPKQHKSLLVEGHALLAYNKLTDYHKSNAIGTVDHTQGKHAKKLPALIPECKNLSNDETIRVCNCVLLTYLSRDSWAKSAFGFLEAFKTIEFFFTYMKGNKGFDFWMEIPS